MSKQDEFKTPLKALPDLSPRTPAPAIVPLISAWLGLLALIGAITVPFLRGSRDPVRELERARPFSPADYLLPAVLYTCIVAIFLGIVVFWQMRRHPRPLEAALAAQRVQAGVGIGLSLAAVVFVYVFVALRGPGGHI